MIGTEHLCKAKRTDNDEWVTGFYLFDSRPDGGSFIVCYDEYSGYAFTVDPSTLCRCVGIEDKTGNLIWENDIIEKEFYTDYDAYANSEKYSGVVRWSGFCAWEIETKRGSIFLAQELAFADFKNHCKVVGNVFDNPELLEEIGIKKEQEELEL